MHKRVLAVHCKLHFDSQSHSLQFVYYIPTSSCLLHPMHEISLAGLCTGILNNDQSVSLIPKMASRDYKFLNPGSQD